MYSGEKCEPLVVDLDGNDAFSGYAERTAPQGPRSFHWILQGARGERRGFHGGRVFQNWRCGKDQRKGIDSQRPHQGDD